MTLSENVKLGMDGLLSHKLRSILTMLGIIFGVAAVVAMQSIGAGAKKELLDAIKVLGVNNIIIKWNEQEADDLKESISKNPGQLSFEDVQALKEVLNNARYVVPVRNDDQTVYLPQKQKIQLVGTTPEYTNLLSYQIVEGRFINESDIRDNFLVGVLTASLKRKLFPLESAVNKKVKVGNQWIKIVGVIENIFSSTKIEGLETRDQSTDLFVPIKAMQTRFGRANNRSPLQEIYVQVYSENMVQSIANTSNRIMERRHRNANDYEVVVPIELLKQSQKTQRIFNIVMGAIASISLLVGGIGIMNIMLSNVLERTREIGIRRAVGAKRHDVVLQFLIEAVLLCIIGGIIGVILGALMAWAITLYAGWMTVIGIQAIIIAFGVSAGVGILFGWWPAKKAAEMDVINSLRYE